MKEYISFETAEKVSETLGAKFYLCHGKPEKCWRYESTSSGAHPSAPYIDDLRYDDDPFDYYPEVWFAFSWEELFELMNKVVLGDYRKSEFECIENIDEFALELYAYIKEQHAYGEF